MKTITFFNNKSGVGKTTLVYHMAWMCAELGLRVLAVDLDPQANLTTMFLDEETLEMIWPEDGHHQSILSCISPIIDGLGDIADAPLQQIHPRIHLLPGDLGLSQFEDRLSDSWLRCLPVQPSPPISECAINLPVSVPKRLQKHEFEHEMGHFITIKTTHILERVMRISA